MKTFFLSLVEVRRYSTEISPIVLSEGSRGGLVVKTLRYKPASSGFDSRLCHWNFSVTSSFRSHYGPGVNSASNKNEYQVYYLGVKVAGA
jgi:hypothetical protein